MHATCQDNAERLQQVLCPSGMYNAQLIYICVSNPLNWKLWIWQYSRYRFLHMQNNSKVCLNISSNRTLISTYVFWSYKRILSKKFLFSGVMFGLQTFGKLHDRYLPRNCFEKGPISHSDGSSGIVFVEPDASPSDYRKSRDQSNKIGTLMNRPAIITLQDFPPYIDFPLARLTLPVKIPLWGLFSIFQCFQCITTEIAK